MAQDFGDDVGELFIRNFERAAEQALRYHLAHRDNDMGIREVSDEPDENRLVCVPFGKEEDAAYFAQVLVDNGIDAVPLTDYIRNGYVQFPAADLEGIKACVPQFAELMTKRYLERIEWSLDSGPVPESRISRLRESTVLSERAGAPSDLEQGEIAAPSRSNHTQAISDKVRAAREQCTNFGDFERILAGEGVGISTTKAGENLFYEARFTENGRMLPFGRDKDGHMDWAVGADTLKKRWGWTRPMTGSRRAPARLGALRRAQPSRQRGRGWLTARLMPTAQRRPWTRTSRATTAWTPTSGPYA